MYYIDLSKAIAWREQLHPRDVHGKFTTIKAGSKVCTSTGKNGTVEEVGNTHYSIRFSDGKKGKVKKENAIHEQDFLKVEAAKKKGKKLKAAAAKGKVTKEKTKANGTGKAKVIEPPAATVSAKPVKPAATVSAKPVKPAATVVTKPVKPAATVKGAEVDMSPNSRDTLKTQAVTVPHGKVADERDAKSRQQVALRTLAEIEDQNTDNPEAKKATEDISSMWQSKAVQKLMQQDPAKRTRKQIQKLAGDITTKNDNLARYLTLKIGDSRGLNLLHQVNRVGDVGDVTIQETGYYGDLLQAARSTMYETLYRVMQGSQHVDPKMNMGAFVAGRIHQKLTRDVYDLMNEIPVPHAIRSAVGDMVNTEARLAQQLGRTPSSEELAKELESTSKHFKEAPIMAPPYFDEKLNKFVATKSRLKDPVARLKQLENYAMQQRTMSVNNTSDTDDSADNEHLSHIADTTATPEEQLERKERLKELKEQIPKALNEIGLTPEEKRVFMVMYGQASSTTRKSNRTMPEVASVINQLGGLNGKQITDKDVYNIVRQATKKIAAAREANHPAIERLAMLKSLFFNLVMRGVYQMDLVKSLSAFGMGVNALTPRFTRVATGSDLVDLQKSIMPYEHIGSVIVTEDGGLHARLYEYGVAEDNELYKAFTCEDNLSKSMFPHKAKSNHTLNKNASEYVKANKGKYSELSGKQHKSVKDKEGGLTWSEQLLVDNPGSVWVTWGGKRILMNAGSGDIIYDSANEVHRQEHNNSASEEKLNFHHEEDEEHKDAGVEAFKEHMQGMKAAWNELKPQTADKHKHQVAKAYASTTDDVREALDKADSEEDKEALMGKAIEGLYEKDALKDLFREYLAKSRGTKLKRGEEDPHFEEFFKKLGALAGKDSSSALITSRKMATLCNAIKKLDPDNEEDWKSILQNIGKLEIQRGREEANKKLLPEGAFMIGNPVTGDTMVVKIKHALGAGEGSKKTWTSLIDEAFDPEGGNHEDINSWGALQRALGLAPTKSFQENLANNANTSEDKPFMKMLSNEEYSEYRGKTRLGLQESMAHKNFKMSREERDRKGNLISRTYTQSMEDGSENTVKVNKDGYIMDPIMARLLQQRKPIQNAQDLHDVMKNAVGNTAWVTAHFGSDIHSGDALGHHVKLQYDGKGAPLVVGGAYNGYRFMDQRDVPKGATDAATGEPIKALFKNGKLVDRKFTTRNEVPLKEGNAVMYPSGDGKYHKGRINLVLNEGYGHRYKVTDGHGHVIGMFAAEDLKQATEDGKTLSQSGQAVVRLAKTGVHRMNTAEALEGVSEKNTEAFKAALKKAGVHATDKDNNLKEDLELTDAAHKKLTKILSKNKAGKELLSHFNSAYTKELELHVPNALREQIEAEGVAVGANGTAKISAAKFEQLREVLGGLSIDSKARQHLEDHFSRKDRKPKTIEELNTRYQPGCVDHSTDFGKHYKAQFKDGSFLLDPKQGLYSAQLEGVAHLIERGRGIVGHGMGVGKTIEGVVAGLHYKADKLANGEKPKKTLIVAPAGIMSDWGKEIGTHTNSKALYIGAATLKKKGADGNYIKKNGRHTFGQDGTEQEAVGTKHFLANTKSIGSEDHDFHIISYHTFMANRDKFTASGLYDNIVIDEVHAFKKQRSRRGTALAESTDKFKNVWALSGTPLENDATELHSLIDTVTGGKHELGNATEFKNNYLLKDKNGKVIGIKPQMEKRLGDIVANIVQFRSGSDVKFGDGSSVSFPALVGQGDAHTPSDFMGNMVDRNRDHATTEYYGTKHSVFDYKPVTHTIEGENGTTYDMHMTVPSNLTAEHKEFYDRYNDMQSKLLPESKLKQIAKVATTGYDEDTAGGKQGRNYLSASLQLQKYLNAPIAAQAYAPNGNALEAEEESADQLSTASDSKASSKSKLMPYNPQTGEGHYIVDGNGYKRYFESDNAGGYAKNADGTPKLLPPLHYNNPKAEYLKQRISTYLDNLAKENESRAKDGRPELMPKVVVKSAYTSFGTDVIDNVLKDIQNEHPHLAYWAHKLGKEGKELSTGSFTGENTDRETIKTGFRGNKSNYANDQGHMWATSVSNAGKEGVDFGNAHLMLMYEQDFNPQKMAQFTARVRRSDSDKKAHSSVGKSNSVRVESLHMPGTIEDFMFNAEDAKMRDIKAVTEATRHAEKSPKLGESEGSIATGAGFTRNQKRSAQAKPKNAIRLHVPSRPTSRYDEDEDEVASTVAEKKETMSKGIKLVVIIDK